MFDFRLILAAGLLWLSGQSALAAFITSAYTGPAISIPDNVPAGVNLDILVPDGLVMNQFQSVSIFMSTDAAGSPTGAHSWIGDLVLTLTHVESGLSIDLMRRVGSSTVTGFGDSSDFGGLYTFTSLTPLSRMVDAASSVGGTANTPNGTYNPTTNLFNGIGSPTFSGEVRTDLNAVFDLMGPLAGTWRLNISDQAGGDVGQIVGWQFTADVSSTPVPAGFWIGLAGCGMLPLLRRNRN